MSSRAATDLVHHLISRIERATDPNIDAPAPPDVVEPELVVQLVRARRELGRWLHAATVDRGPDHDTSLADRLADEVGVRLRRRNQFAVLDQDAVAELARLYRSSATVLAAALTGPVPDHELEPAVAEVFARHHTRLRAALVQQLGVALPTPVVDASYSAALQLHTLGLHTDRLPGPVLDVGSGPEGLLVRHLRQHGIAAWGLDRHSAAPHVLTGDWLAVDPRPDTWGTVVSHLAFSLHFHHVHHRVGNVAYRYADRYRRLLGSLTTGGTFAYTPRLPFIEAVLPADRFRVAAVPALPGTPVPLRADRAAPALGATHVIRLR